MTMTITEEVYGSVKKITFDWATASSSAGAVSGATTKAYNGALERLVTIPDTSAAPTASYDLTCSDQDTTDTLMGGGANRHTTNIEQVGAASLGIVANDKLTLKVTNAGSSKAGVVHLYIR